MDTPQRPGTALLWVSIVCFAIGLLAFAVGNATPHHGLDGLGQAIAGVLAMVGFGSVGIVLGIVGTVMRWRSQR